MADAQENARRNRMDNVEFLCADAGSCPDAPKPRPDPGRGGGRSHRKGFRVYANADVIGVELGGALKNIIALCAGISDGLGYGDNTKAMLMTRGLTEIARLGLAMGARQETFAGLAGIGDLVVTCTSMHSRNRRAGILLGQGQSPQQAMQAVGAVVEGYYATRSAHLLAESLGAKMPITEAVYRVLYENCSAGQEARQLLLREKGPETENASWNMELPKT